MWNKSSRNLRYGSNIIRSHNVPLLLYFADTLPKPNPEKIAKKEKA